MLPLLILIALEDLLSELPILRRGGGPSSGDALREFRDRGRGRRSRGGGVGSTTCAITGEISSAGSSTGCSCSCSCSCCCLRFTETGVAGNSAGSWSSRATAVLIVVRVPVPPGMMKMPSTSEGWCFNHCRVLGVPSSRISRRMMVLPKSWTVKDFAQLGSPLRKIAFSTTDST